MQGAGTAGLPARRPVSQLATRTILLEGVAQGNPFLPPLQGRNASSDWIVITSGMRFRP